MVIMAVHYASVSGMLNSVGIDISQDFFTLNSSQVSSLIEMAKIQGYYKPKNANGSRARYYFAALQRDYRKTLK
jgi:hypothetical protein